MKGWLRVSACAALVLASTGCGPRFAPDELVRGGASPTADVIATSTDAPIGHSPLEAPGAPGSQAAASESAPSSTQDSTSTPTPRYGPRHNNGVVRIELSATCVKPGDLLIVTLRTPPKAGLGMVIGYSDHQAHGALLTGESDANGVYVWRVLVEPTVPEGKATVLVTSTGPNWSSEGGGTGDAPFEVSRSGC